MKSLIATLFFTGFVGFGATAQTASIPGGAPQDIFFRGFENVVFVHDNQGLNRKFRVSAEGGEVIALQGNDGTTSTGRYKVNPGESKNVVLVIADAEGNEMNRYSYSISLVPDNDIRFATEDGKFSMNQPKLILHNSAHEFLEKLNEIVSWTVLKEGNIIGQGKGSELDMITMGQLSLLSEGTNFEVEVAYMDNKGITRIKTVSCTK